MSRTVGIDLAAEPAGTAIAGIEWDGQSATLSTLTLGASDDLVLSWLRQPDIVGVDCPFGWPVKFVELITAHAGRSLVVAASQPKGWRREYVLRATDRFVHAETGLIPLSVAADKIGHIAIRFASLMAQLGPEVDAPRDGSGAIAEVYPAAALKLWGLPFRRYKGRDNRLALGELVDALCLAAPWLDLGEFEALCRRSDDALDAVLCALVARCVSLGRTVRPPDVEVARLEGWIHLPIGSLQELAPAVS